jgi:RNA polymerase sigma factor (sigma-70 family)
MVTEVFPSALGLIVHGDGGPMNVQFPINLHQYMMLEDYREAYERDFDQTVRFGMLQGASREIAVEIAEAAWTRVRANLGQVPDRTNILVWVNATARLLLIRNGEHKQRATSDAYRDAFEAGFRQTVQFLRLQGATRQDAEEFAQAAWAKGWERLGQLSDAGKIFVWINALARNLLRENRRRNEMLIQLRSTDDPGVPPKVNPASLDLRRILRTTKQSERVIVTRRYFEGYAVKEIARAYGATERAIRRRLAQARLSLQQRMLPKSEQSVSASGSESAVDPKVIVLAQRTTGMQLRHARSAGRK